MKGGGTGSIEAIGVPAVLDRASFYMEALGAPYYSIWQQGVIKFPGLAPDRSDALAQLKANIEGAAPNAGTSTYCFKLHPELDQDGYITNKTPVIGSFNFKLNEYTGYTMGNVTTPPPANGAADQSAILAPILEILRRQEERMEALEEQLYAEPKEEEEEDPTIVEKIISGINASPQLSGLVDDLRGFVKIFIHKLVPAGPVQQQPNMTQSATMNDQEKVQYAFSILIPLLPDLPDMLKRLADLATSDREAFDFVVKKMRSAL
jgi:hypothetical protein